MVVAGGSKTDDFNEFLSIIKHCVLNGASGVSVGRNVFQSDDPKVAMQKIRETLDEVIQEVDHLANFY